MLNLIVQNIICFQTQFPTISNNILALFKSDLIILRAPKSNFVHAKTSLRARYVHNRHRARNLSSPEMHIGQHQNLKLQLLCGESYELHVMDVYQCLKTIY